jgi:lysophospholipase L1-like esterase
MKKKFFWIVFLTICLLFSSCVSKDSGDKKEGECENIESGQELSPEVNLEVPKQEEKTESVYEGKVVSVLGDSISTFAGYIPVNDGYNLAHRARYPQDNLLTDVNLTWWKRLCDKMGFKLGVNDSWAGSTVSNTISGNSGDLGEDASMASVTRISNLGSNGTPDLIFFYGGTNDIGRALSLGTLDTTKNYSKADLTSTKWETFADAYKTAIMRLQYYYPKTKIVSLLPTYTKSYYTNAELFAYNEQIIQICDYFGVTYFDLRKCGINMQNVDDYLPDGIHPNAEGMKVIADYVQTCFTSTYAFEKGENIVYKVENNLSNLETSVPHIVGVSLGKPYSATLIPDGLFTPVNVCVKMGGKDITATCYSEGKIKIDEVAGDIEVFAVGRKTETHRATQNSHAQELPVGLTSNTNIWKLLESEDVYYNGTDWVKLNEVRSVTFAVCNGDRIYASSFLSKAENLGTSNGIRITYFNDDVVIKSCSPTEIYSEYLKKGYVTVPEGANAVCVSMWKEDESNFVYLLTA